MSQKGSHLNTMLKLVVSCCWMLVAGCAADPNLHNSAGRSEPFFQTMKFANGTTVTGALVNGQWQGAVTQIDANGRIIRGTLLNSQWQGPVEITEPSGAKCTGEYVNKEQDGLWKCHTQLNDLTTFVLFSAGKVLKSFSELEQLWASGNYEEAYRIRGKKSLLGINLKADEKTSEIFADVVQIHSPAFISGFKAGDVIVAFDGEPVTNVASFIKRIVATPFGKEVRVDILRSGKKISLSVVPATIPQKFSGADGRPVKSSFDRLWEYYSNLDSAEGYSRYIEYISDPTYKAVAASRLQAALQREKNWLQATIDARNMVQLADYIDRNVKSPLRSEAIDGAIEILQKSKSKAPAYLDFVGRCPTCAELLPSEYGILVIGPAGMTVADLLRLSEQGIGADVIAAKVEGSAAEYKDFTFKEIAFLNKLNVPSSVVSAMIRSTHANAGKKLQEQNRKLQEENIQLRRKAAETVSTQQNTASASSPAANEECLQLNLALAACDQGSGLLKVGCRIIAQSSFKCSSPGYR